VKVSLGGAVLEEFEDVEQLNPGDIAVLERQLGRKPRGDVFVVTRCPRGRPAVILTVPFQGDDRPTPPPLWLTCPCACREAARLEGKGVMKRFQLMLEERAEAFELFMREEEHVGSVNAELARLGGSIPPERLRGRGIAGGRPGAVKCLHAHLAYRLASGRGVVGGWCLEELESRTGCWCERIPEACLT
jgi:hypothetical protein